MKKNLALAALTLGLGLYASASQAQIFKLEFKPAGGVPQPLIDQINAEVQKVEDDINKDLPAADSPGRLMEGMANSSIMAGKGIGSDYASDMKVAIIGAGVGVGADLEKNKAADTDLSGAGIQGGIMLGTKLGWMDTQKILGLDTDRLSVFVNFFKYEHEMETGDTDAKADLSTFGFHFTYDWIKGNNSKMFGWGGVQLHTGYEYNSTKLRFSSKITESVSGSSGGANYNSSIVADPTATVDITSHSIPIEISSSVRFLYIFSFFGGLGMDINSGTAEGKGDLNSQTADVTCSGGVCGGGPTDVGDVETSANIDGKGDANPFLFRAFAGLQLNLPFVRVYVQADKALGNELVAASTGIRFVY